LNPDRSKLSKRQGDVAVEDYRAKGYLHEALVNFVALLGWTAGDDKEYYSIAELVDAFALERVNKSGAVFDLQKLNWLNAEHLRKKSSLEIAGMLRGEMTKASIPSEKFSDAYLVAVVDAMRERVSFVHEIVENARYFFLAPESYDEATVKKRWTAESAGYLAKYAEEVEKITGNEKEQYEQALHDTAERLDIKGAQIIHPLRIAVSGVGGGPGVYDIVQIIGKEETLKRIQSCITSLK
jgi:glutamyl-tRNA synthetase